MISDEQQKISSQGMSLQIVWRNPRTHVRASLRARQAKRSLLPVGRTSQQDSRSAVQLGHQQQLG
jgi:hypothetical protein